MFHRARFDDIYSRSHKSAFRRIRLQRYAMSDPQIFFRLCLLFVLVTKTLLFSLKQHRVRSLSISFSLLIVCLYLFVFVCVSVFLCKRTRKTGCDPQWVSVRVKLLHTSCAGTSLTRAQLSSIELCVQSINFPCGWRSFYV